MARLALLPHVYWFPHSKLEEVNAIAKEVAQQVRVGNPEDENTNVGPMVSEKQYERVQSYIQIGVEEGAELLAGGIGKPEGLELTVLKI